MVLIFVNSLLIVKEGKKGGEISEKSNKTETGNGNLMTRVLTNQNKQEEENGKR